MFFLNYWFTGLHAKRYSTNIQRIRSNTVIRRRKLFDMGTKRTKSSITRSYGPDLDYGLAEPLDNIISNEDLNMKKKVLLEKLSNVNRTELERITREQAHSQDWLNERKKRLTASNFGEICKMRSNTSCRKKVYGMLYKPHTSTKQMTYGVEMEPHARVKFEELSGHSVQLCGLFTDIEFPYLAATPGNYSTFNTIQNTKYRFRYIFKCVVNRWTSWRRLHSRDKMSICSKGH